jgi:putative hydrolase of the HAD superfamily
VSSGVSYDRETRPYHAAARLGAGRAIRYTETVRALPRAILFDLDDTILRAYVGAERAWTTVANELAENLVPFEPPRVVAAIGAVAQEFWADAERHRYWRQRLAESRRVIVRRAFADLDAEGRVLSDAVAVRVADRFTRLRDEEMRLYPDAWDTLDALRRRGVALGLVTNGAAETQRPKIARFDLERRFDHIQIEGEHGFGKPEERAYLHALAKLGVGAHETWMVGDHLEWEVAAPQRLGIHAIWYDGESRGLPAGTQVRPDRVICRLAELLPPAE